MTVPMAIVDYIPVALFGAAAVLLLRDLYNKMSKGAFALLGAGVMMIFVAGCFKATWKLLYALNVCDFEALNAVFFPMQTTGFVLAAAALIALLTARQGHGAAYAVAAAPYTSSMIFVVLTVLGTLGICTCLTVIAARMKRRGAAVLFVVAFVFMLAMGYLSSRDFTEASMNWIAQCTNIVGQGALLGGVCLLHRAGLAEPKSIPGLVA